MFIIFVVRNMKNMSLQKIQAQDRNSLFNKVKQNKTYLYIRLMGIKEPKLQKPQQTTLGDKKLRLRFEMSNKVCSTSFETNNFGTIPQKQLSQLQKQTHLFCYEAEEMLNMQLNVYKQSKQSTKAKICQYGYSRVVISPFIALPHTRHCVDVPMIQSDCYQKVGNQTIAVVSLQIFYLLKFQGELCIYPYQGNFQRSLLLGEMRLCCIFQMNGQRQKSILDQQGGIHPRWHQFAKSLDPKKLLNKEQKKYESNMLKFKLDSVGHTLKLEVVNFPELDKDAQIVGSAQIYIASKDYLRVPKSNKNENEKRKKIKLTYIDPVTKLVSEAGQIEVGVIFDFDAKTQRLLADSQSQQQSSEQNES